MPTTEPTPRPLPDTMPDATRRALAAAGLLAPLGGSLAAALTSPAAAAQAPAGGPRKVLRYAFPTAETSFDPTQIGDLYSRIITGHIFEALYTYDHLARPVRLKPLTAAALPEASDNFRTWRITIKPGIHFADDPAFKGQRRELVAQDYVFALKRYADPRLNGQAWSDVAGQGFAGLVEAHERTRKSGQPFDYDAPIEGLRSTGRYTLEIRLAEPRPRFVEFLAASDLYGAVAREVVQAYGDDIAAHPVGTGPFRLKQWRRGSLIVLERNPGYRERFYDAEPSADDVAGQRILARLKGRRLPMVDEVRVSIVQENQPRWLSFLNDEHDLIQEVPAEYVDQALPRGVVAPYLARQGVQGELAPEPTIFYTFFNMEDPVVGGYTPDKVALRRAIGLGLDAQQEIDRVLHGQGQLAQSPLVPFTTAFDPAFRSTLGEYNPARAQALLDLYGYVDRDQDGWRELPDGQPLVLQWSIEDSLRARQRSELWQRNMKALGLRVAFKPAQWPELLKAARAGRFQVWHLGNQAAAPDSLGALLRYFSKDVGGQNLARFKRPEFDAVYERLDGLPDGPERKALFREAERLAAVWMPYRPRYYNVSADLTHRQVIGYRRTVFWLDWWQYVDIEPGATPTAP